ncbi:CoB--CoM heterodisulfide reductase iron-sulfur subunit B family protein [Parasporobacterium paucivorans]|uniref:Heterodisulfide reductase subunit B n=1 Tax=Parasporobacterium paucivorans DSM 15970 TaxID=1122934 RepID=A0A1M6DHD8_9FIRM|nr:CoB--CoM heterodisulfide reductase iron-sulfur subunit B family protein [Parasporobacterium paucivorans]SHI72551.1 heterodisulfide reductase subunit B [Parasporobacterium paucivorans DSM 15970]
MLRYAYYPGCSMDSTGATYKKSIEFVAEKIGLDLREIKDWNCCGATAAHTKDEMMALALPARNLALAESEDLGLDIAIPCAACYSRMKYSLHAVRTDEEKKEQIQEIIEMPYEGKNDVLSFLDIFSTEEAMEACRSKMVRTLSGLKVACYYGCLLSRPHEVTGGEDTENPMDMDRIVALTGAEPVDWSFKTECCGASHQVDVPKEARPLLDRILRNAQANGAQAIVTACPLCNMNLDMRQAEINEKMEKKYNLPVYQFTELLAVAMGAGAKEIGLHKHFFPAFELMKKYAKRAGENG